MSEIKEYDSSFQCAPALKRQPGEPCLSFSALDRMRRVWNRYHPSHKIKLPTSTRKIGSNNSNTNARILWKSLRHAMHLHYKCETEFCTIKKMPGLTKEERSQYQGYFRPEKPEEWEKNPTTWLDSFNIEDVMNQYEKADPTFEFIGPVPIDFDLKMPGNWGKCIVDELCKLDIRKVRKQKIGIIFNLDAHDEPGSHWVCAYVDIPEKKAYYFDSYGYPPPQEVDTFLKRCKEQGCSDVYYNDIRHQRKGSECGMYCLYILISLVRGKDFYTLCKNIVKDDLMNVSRDLLFATETPRKNAIEEALPKLFSK